MRSEEYVCYCRNEYRVIMFIVSMFSVVIGTSPMVLCILMSSSFGLVRITSMLN